MDYDKVRAVARAAGLKSRDITGARNGYPEPFLGIFISGFDTFEAAKRFAQEHHGDVGTAEYRDGWQMVNRFYYCREAIDTESWFTRNLDLDNNVIGGFAYLEHLFEEMIAFDNSNGENATLRRLLAEAREAHAADPNVVFTLVGNDLTAYKEKELRLSYDTRTEEVGVAFFADDEDTDEKAAE